jgi:hypothetical protein
MDVADDPRAAEVGQDHASSGIEGWQIRVAVERPSGVGEARVQVRAYPRQVLGRLVDERHHCGE